ncbi:MAG: riboflavin synthase [Alphaproteobacteria bacterium]|nr:riboflavin synthase [Pseudomonadota bacterium]TDI66197.1 MAG: riboflavin synthase [Alphaproteobacteria bacterium]
MFTGIITDIGTVRSIAPGTDSRISIATGFDVDELDIGASIACSGPCLTVVAKGRDGGQGWFAVEVSAETLARTTLGRWAPGHRVNLERAMRLGDELGGHMVSGHVDGIATLRARAPVGGEDGSVRLTFQAPPGSSKLVAEKGSVTLDGVSLTVNHVADDSFSVNLIPHTLENTTLGDHGEGADVNFEADMIARYLNRLALA